MEIFGGSEGKDGYFGLYEKASKQVHCVNSKILSHPEEQGHVALELQERWIFTSYRPVFR